MSNLRVATLASLLLLNACSRNIPVAKVEVIDTSPSITTRAEKAALDAVHGQISHLGRGDSLVLIPITGDAANDVGGRILRFHAPTMREPYDADLARFRADAEKRFTAWVESLDPHQSRTDILGALDAARQEFAALPKADERRLIVASDFLEDDGAYDFVRDRSLATPARARALAARLRVQHDFALPGAMLCLGLLESRDFAPLPEQRKAAVQAFWTDYFTESGQQLAFHFDGMGMLADAEQGCFGGK